MMTKKMSKMLVCALAAVALSGCAAELGGDQSAVARPNLGTKECKGQLGPTDAEGASSLKLCRTVWKALDSTDDFVLESTVGPDVAISIAVSEGNLRVTVESDDGDVKELLGGATELRPDPGVTTPVVPATPFAPGDRIRVCDLTTTMGSGEVTLSDGATKLTRLLQLVRPCAIDDAADKLDGFEPCVETDGIRIAVDASRDGGRWWSPQKAGAEDPMASHTGRKLANALGEWAAVVELPREAWVGPMALGCQDLVVRPSSAGLPAYHAQEVAAYLAYVAAGGQLLLLSDKLGSAGDQIAEAFGLELAGSTTGRAQVRFDQGHPLGQGVANLEFRGGACVKAAPEGATEFAWYGASVYCDLDGDLAFDSSEPKGTTAALHFAYGLGAVVWVADTDALLGAPQAFLDNLAGSIAI